MVSSGDIRIRISSEQRELLKQKASKSGKSLSSYIREKALSDDSETSLLIKEMYNKICLQKAYKIDKYLNKTLVKTRL